MHISGKAAILTGLLLLCGLSLKAQQKASIQGTVTTVENGARVPVDYAVILLKPAGVYTTTDEKGAYRLGGLDPGSYNLNIQLIGYETIDTTLTIRGEVRRDFVLTQSSFRLEEVHVVAEASKAGESTASMISYMSSVGSPTARPPMA